MQNIPVISICIPANGRIEYVRNTLNSIYSEKNLFECDQNDFEVIVSDNNSSKSLEILLKEFRYSNFKYFYTECEGFMNSYFALTYGNGYFIKLHNSQEIFNPGALLTLISNVKSNLTKKPLMFFTAGLLKKGTICEYDNFNEFNYNLSYLSSWSNGISIWKEDFDLIDASASLNTLFPHTSIFFTQHYKNGFVINDQNLFTTQFIKKRGGHNKFHAFTIEYPSLIENACNKGYIKLDTKNKIFKDILYNYLPLLFFNVKIAKRETFSSEGFQNDIKVYFPKWSYWLVLVFSFLFP
ncbi:glycosyltransferase involved in cell wall biosynthesis [Flavobacterium sp. 1]|uniref:glycosyltransferase family 2 protein n=1 Tax=Flavobacterium sp. 1 TaxID=2035200 RepID=UPI000CAFB07B|nr:glycosyltransferase family 2 protein [Flavobacterium sp. 1]PJJ11117.1 glycosyltransferase involved in cell wall biosynthesis [Flavobacterium sp. 1]